MANNYPIYSRVGDVQWSSTATTVANTTVDLTSGTSYLVFTADTTNGGYVQRIRFKSLGTNTTSVARIWLNNGLTTTSSSNNSLIDEITLNSTTVTQLAALAVYELPLNFAVPPGYRIYITLGTAVAAGYDVTVFGGKY